jgi:excisionase family DNA binding protein
VEKGKERLTTKEAAEELGVTEGRIRQMMKAGIITDVEKFGKSHAISAAEINELKQIERKTGRPKKEATKE